MLPDWPNRWINASVLTEEDRKELWGDNSHPRVPDMDHAKGLLRRYEATLRKYEKELALAKGDEETFQHLEKVQPR